MRLRWLRTATFSRFEQLDYVARDNPSAAVRLDREIARQTNLLKDHPLIGRQGRVPGTRELAIVGSPYLAVYRIKNKRVEVLRILHGAQQWPKA